MKSHLVSQQKSSDHGLTAVSLIGLLVTVSWVACLVRRWKAGRLHQKFGFLRGLSRAVSDALTEADKLLRLQAWHQQQK